MKTKLENIRIVENSKFWFTLSGIVIIAGIVMMIIFGGLNLSIDFKGGTMLQIDIGTEFNSDDIKQIMIDQGYQDYEIRKAAEDTQVIIRTVEMTNEESQKIFKAIQEKYGLENDALLNSENISSVMGKESAQKALIATIVASVLMLLYITVRFEFRFAVSAIIALIHDILFVVAIFAIFRLSVNMTFVAAILTILGYSINNTIVIFDRVRENVKGKGRTESLEHAINKSIGQSMTRTINTSLTTLFVLVALLIFGGDSIRNFALALTVGVTVGTYSSICMAGSIYNLLKKVGAKKN